MKQVPWQNDKPSKTRDDSLLEEELSRRESERQKSKLEEVLCAAWKKCEVPECVTLKTNMINLKYCFMALHFILFAVVKLWSAVSIPPSLAMTDTQNLAGLAGSSLASTPAPLSIQYFIRIFFFSFSSARDDSLFFESKRQRNPKIQTGGTALCCMKEVWSELSETCEGTSLWVWYWRYLRRLRVVYSSPSTSTLDVAWSKMISKLDLVCSYFRLFWIAFIVAYGISIGFLKPIQSSTYNDRKQSSSHLEFC